MAGPLLLSVQAETRVKRRDLPIAVQQAADQVSQGAQIVGFSKEVENGQTLYEVELKVNGFTRDVTLDAQGQTVSVEQEVTLASLPTAVQEGLKKAAGKGRITRVESVTKGNTVQYEAGVKGGPKKEVLVDANGALVSH